MSVLAGSVLAVSVGAGLVAKASAQDRAAIEAGGEIYKEKCEGCHGARMQATGAGADLRQLRANERPRFDKAIKEGRNQMPSWDGELDDADIENLWAYQRSRAND